MRGADGVAAHVLQGLDLSDEGTFVDGSPQGTEVVVQTDTLQLARHAVQLETTLLGALHCTDAELLTDFIDRLAVSHVFDTGYI